MPLQFTMKNQDKKNGPAKHSTPRAARGNGKQEQREPRDSPDRQLLRRKLKVPQARLLERPRGLKLKQLSLGLSVMSLRS